MSIRLQESAFLLGYDAGHAAATKARDLRDAESAIWDAAIWLVMSLSLGIGQMADRSYWLAGAWAVSAVFWIGMLIRSIFRLRRLRNAEK